ncbi:MAG TPA: rRNA maturation RNase YbeY [Puia sp.]|nr:rRNA maturation RNase YbeY [Puia sp.]
MGDAGNEILFFTGDIRFSLKNKIAVAKWLHSISRKHKKKITSLNYIFVSDDYLLDINKRFLRHNTLTDIISFDYSADKKAKNGVVGEIYISIPRVYENAGKFKTSKTDELHRVMAHGLLHLCGFGDKTLREIKRMRTEEENALDLRQF